MMSEKGSDECLQLPFRNHYNVIEMAYHVKERNLADSFLPNYMVFHFNMSLYDNLYLNNCRRYESQDFLKTINLKFTQQKFELKKPKK